jgi:hypothetical protein
MILKAFEAPEIWEKKEFQIARFLYLVFSA